VQTTGRRRSSLQNSFGQRDCGSSGEWFPKREAAKREPKKWQTWGWFKRPANALQVKRGEGGEKSVGIGQSGGGKHLP